MSAANNRTTGQCIPTKVTKYYLPASVAISVGSFGFKSRTDGKFYPMSSFTWTTDLATTRLNAARYFAGVSNTRRLSTETDTTTTGEIVSQAEVFATCSALGAAYDAGTLVTFGDNGDSTLSNTTVAITTDPALAIGRLSRPAASGATVVHIVFDAAPSNLVNLGAALPPAKYTTGTAATFAAGALTGAAVTTYANSGANATLTVRTAAQMFADTPGAYIGLSTLVMIRNTHATTATITADGGATVTLTGTMTIAQNTTRIFTLTFDSATAATLQSLGTGAAAA